MKKVEDHPFRYVDNLTFCTIADDLPETETIEALYERGYINPMAINAEAKKIGDAALTKVRKVSVMRLCVKKYFDDTVLRSDIKKCLISLKGLVVANRLRQIGVIRDLAIMNLAQWLYFVEQFEEILKNLKITVTFYTNTLVVPPVDRRFKVIKEYHESTVGGHRGINKTYNRIAKDYYWRNMRPDVRQFVLGCASCQTKKLVRVKTKQALLITDTPSRPFEKISIDLYGPINTPSAYGNTHILSIQDWLTKYIVLAPVQRATAEETVRALIDKFISYFGAPEKLLSDRGTHFMNKSMEELARLFKIEKIGSTAFHPQSNGAIERMHHVLTEYLKAYIDKSEKWDELLPLCTLAYNTSEHESTGYTPYELLFGQKARLPSSFKQPENGQTYSEFYEQTVDTLTQMRTLAAMTQVQAKYRSKYYYDRKSNTKFFMEGEMVYVLKEPSKGKYDAQYEGPYEITGIDYKKHNVKLQRGDEIRVTHVDKIKKASVLKTASSNE